CCAATSAPAAPTCWRWAWPPTGCSSSSRTRSNRCRNCATGACAASTAPVSARTGSRARRWAWLDEPLAHRAHEPRTMKLPNCRAAALAAALLAATAVHAGEAEIRKNLGAIPQLGQIDEVRKSPMPGVWEVRTGFDIYYTDE